jgi:transcriptional regulator with XRE-family HTH domain
MRGMRDLGKPDGRALRINEPGRPTVDQAYERVVGEFLAGSPLDGDEAFAALVAKRFREGPARICSKAIGDWIEHRLVEQGWTQQDLADRVGVDRSAVARWTAGGTLSLGHLVLVLIEFRGELADLPWPARRELALEAYLATLAFVRARLEPNPPALTLDREQFWCLYHLFAEPHWEQAIRSGDPASIRGEAGRILRKAGASLGHAPGRVSGADGLRSLVDEWAATWVVCLKLLPNDWAIR